MRIEYHRVLLADHVRNAAFHAALQKVIVKGKTTVADIGAGTGFLGFLAAKLGALRVDLYETAEIAAIARKLLQAQPPVQLPHRRGAFDRRRRARPRRHHRLRDARQLPLRGKHHRHAQRRARAFPQTWRHHHPRRGRAVRLSGGWRAPVSRHGGLGRGRLRARLRAGQAHEPQQHLRALAGARRPARRRRCRQGLGPGAVRPQEQDHPHGRDRAGSSPDPPPSTASPCGGRPTLPRVCGSRPARSTPARIGSSSTCRPWSRSGPLPARRCTPA